MLLQKQYTEFLIFYLPNLLNILSPGLATALITQYANQYSRRICLYLCFGMFVGSIAHKTSIYLARDMIFLSSDSFIETIKILGIIFIVFIACKNLFFKKSPSVSLKKSINLNESTIPQALNDRKKDVSSLFSAMRVGFILEMINPQSSLVFFSIFSQVNKETPYFVQVLYLLTVIATAYGWHLLLVYGLTHPGLKSFLSPPKQKLIQKITSGFLLTYAARATYALL